MNYTLRQLEIFSKIAEFQSVTRASEALFLSQPAVSIQLKKLQDQFSIPLFEVVGRQIYITEFGKEIAESAGRVLDEVHAISYKSLAHKGKLAGELKMAIVSTAKYVMPYLLADFIRDNDGVELIMDVTNKETVIRSLENNEVDFAMVSSVPQNINIERIELMKNKLFLVGGKQYTTVNNEITKKDFEQLPLIFRERGSATRLAMEDYIKSRKISAYKKMELTSNEAVKQAVIAGLGVSIMPLIGIKNSLNMVDLKIIPAKGLPIETNWNLIWLSSKKLSHVAKAFVQHINNDIDKIKGEYFGWFEDY
jgi:DNA-binding transcriptional LysR family regulator